MALAPHPMTLRQLQYIVAVADTKNFRLAAERCRVSQPSLSAQVAELEGALGVRLFERDKRRVLLTAAGEDLVERARRLLAAADDLVDAARRHVDPLSGKLRIGVIPTIAPYLLPKVVPALHKAFPSATLAWVEDKTEVLVREVRRGGLDAAMLALEADLGDLSTEQLGMDPFVLAASPSHPLGRRTGKVGQQELAGERVLLLDDGHCFREQALAYCAAARAEELGFRATSLPTLVQMVAAGAGVTLLPRMAVELESGRAALRIREFDGEVPERTIVLGWRKGAAVQEAMEKLAAVMRRKLADQGQVR